MTRRVRVGSVVKIHRGAAAVTGDDPCKSQSSRDRDSHYNIVVGRRRVRVIRKPEDLLEE